MVNTQLSIIYQLGTRVLTLHTEFVVLVQGVVTPAAPHPPAAREKPDVHRVQGALPEAENVEPATQAT